MARTLLGAASFTAILALAGCRGASTPSTPSTSLRITATDRAVGTAVFELQCTPDGGNLADPRAACAAIERDPQLVARPPIPLGLESCASGEGLPWEISIAGRLEGLPVAAKTMTFCWTKRLPLIRTLGGGAGLQSHLVCSSGALVTSRPLSRCTAVGAPVRIVAKHSMHLVPAAPAASRGPAAGIEDVTFLDARDGFDVTGDTSWQINGNDIGKIQATHDGGATWTTVWSRRNAALDWITFVGAHGFAAGETWSPGGSTCCPPEPLLLETSDRGRRWRALRPVLPGGVESWGGVDLQFVNDRVGFAYSDPDEYWNFPGPNGPKLMRTVDGGRHWTDLPGDLANPDFLDARHGFAIGVRGRDFCVFETRDSGTSWHVLPSSCRGFELGAVDFVDARTGFAGGGLPGYAANPFQAVLVTRDGGRSWRTVDRQALSFLPIDRQDMVDATHGFAATGGCKTGQNFPCGGDVLVTNDGGRSWRATRQGVVQLAAVGATRAWVVPDCAGIGCDLMWRTGDAGRTWQPLASAENVRFTSIESGGPWLLADSELGTYRSVNQGRSWSLLVRLHPPGRMQTDAARVVRPGLDAVVVRADEIAVSHDSGRRWTTARLNVRDGFGVSLLAFADAEHGLAAEQGFGCLKNGDLEPSRLFGTSDGGLSWRALSTPPFAIDALVTMPGLSVATALSACGPGRVAFSRNGGRSWRTEALPDSWGCAPSVAPPRTIWLACDRELLTSDDDGATWTELAGERFDIDAAQAPNWVVGARFGGPQTVWETHDGGRTLRRRQLG